MKTEKEIRSRQRAVQKALDAVRVQLKETQIARQKHPRDAGIAQHCDYCRAAEREQFARLEELNFVLGVKK